jgi:hypothetical protein
MTPRPAVGGASTSGAPDVLELHFYPESDRRDYSAAVAEYQRIWTRHGPRIVALLETATGLPFAETFVNAVVFEGVSHSHPLALRASNDAETKLGALVHELAHRLIAGNRVRLGLAPYSPARERENHELIDLFLYDVWVDLAGEEFARRQVAVESGYQPFYRDAWQAVLALDRPARAAKLAELLTPRAPS